MIYSTFEPVGGTSTLWKAPKHCARLARGPRAVAFLGCRVAFGPAEGSPPEVALGERCDEADLNKQTENGFCRRQDCYRIAWTLYWLKEATPMKRADTQHEGLVAVQRVGMCVQSMGCPVIARCKAHDYKQVDEDAPQQPIPVASEQGEKPGKGILQEPPLPPVDDSLKQLCTVGKMICLLVHSLAPQYEGELAISVNCRLILAQTLGLLFYSPAACFWLPRLVFITQHCHWRPIHICEIYPPPPYICQERKL